MLRRSNHVCRLFGNHNGWRIGIATDNRRHDRRIHNTQPIDAMDLQMVINHSHGVVPHFAGTHGMKNRSTVLPRIRF